jgi:hypothetical protein
MTVHENSHNIIDLHQAYSDVTDIFTRPQTIEAKRRLTLSLFSLVPYG